MLGLHLIFFFLRFHGSQTRQKVEVVFIFGEDHRKFNKRNLMDLDLMIIFVGSLVFSVALCLVLGKRRKSEKLAFLVFLIRFWVLGLIKILVRLLFTVENSILNNGKYKKEWNGFWITC